MRSNQSNMNNTSPGSVSSTTQPVQSAHDAPGAPTVSMTHAGLLQMQKRSGNRAVARLLTSRLDAASPIQRTQNASPIQMVRAKVIAKNAFLKLEEGAVVTILKKVGMNWQVECNGKKVWIESKFLEEIPDNGGDEEQVVVNEVANGKEEANEEQQEQQQPQEPQQKPISAFLSPQSVEVVKQVVLEQQEQKEQEIPKEKPKEEQQVADDEMSGSYEEARKIVENQNLTDLKTVKRLGKESMNKNAFHILGTPWVVLATTAGYENMKYRAIKSEVDQMDHMRKSDVPTPDIGPEETDKLFDVQLKNKPAKAFLERFMQGIEMDKNKPLEFGAQIADNLKARKMLNPETLEKVQSDLQRIYNYLDQGDQNEIPDFQVFFDMETNTPMVFDPGDPKTWGNVRETHLLWVKRWLDVMRIELSKFKKNK